MRTENNLGLYYSKVDLNHIFSDKFQNLDSLTNKLFIFPDIL